MQLFAMTVELRQIGDERLRGVVPARGRELLACTFGKLTSIEQRLQVRHLH